MLSNKSFTTVVTENLFEWGGFFGLAGGILEAEGAAARIEVFGLRFF
jgi:hypothetical protein